MTSKLRLLPFLCFVSLLTFFVQDHAFFWDTIQLGSKHAHWFYEQNFQTLLLPPEIDSGHPPTFGLYLAALWKIFGQELSVSHFALLPFLWGIIFLLFQLGDYYLGRKWAFVLPLVILVEPVFAGQSVLVSPDIVLICFFLLGWWAILNQQKRWLMLAALGLAMVSMRGMMVVVVLYVTAVLIDPISRQQWQIFKEKNSLIALKTSLLFLIQKAFPYMPSGFFALAFFAYHYQQTGWIAYHADSPWAGSFEAVNWRGFIKNLAVLIWRMLEFGRLFLWGIMILVGFKIAQKQQLKQWFLAEEQFKLRQLMLLLGSSSMVLLPSMLRYTGLMQNRYFLPIFMVLDVIVLHLIVISWKGIKTQWSEPFYKKTLTFIVVVALMTGNCWIYPKKIAQGWDSTLAHLPYYDLRLQMIAYIDQEHIPYAKIGTRFPNIGRFKEKDLNGATTGFAKADFQRHDYIFYATVMNDFSDAELIELEQHWDIVHQLSTCNIEVILYQKEKRD